MGASNSSLLVTQRKQMEIQRTKLPDPDFYKLIDDRGKGDLVILAKTALKTNNFDILDAAIKEKVVKYLYNEGKGKNISLDQIVSKRVNESCSVVDMSHGPNTIGVIEEKPSNKIFVDTRLTPQSKLIYFNFDKRGKNGETLLHVCQLNNTKHHDLLSKRLIINFPQLINEIALGDEMYGQTIMHICIAQENQLMLHFLLAHKADVHIRCCGSFFLPDDQSMNRIQEIGSEYPIVPIKTDFFGLAYYGEYPLTTAAVLDDRASVRILLTNKANPDMQDSNGNTVMHMMVIYDNMNMIELLIDETKANLSIKNKQGYTPLTLATKLGRTEIATFIMNAMRNINWTYADISCAAYPHKDIDSITEDGQIDSKSFMNILVESTSEEHLELYEGLLTETINKKWNIYVKKKFYMECVFYFGYFILCCITLIVKRSYFDWLKSNGCTYQKINVIQTVNVELTVINSSCRCVYFYANDPYVVIRTILEILVLLYTILYILFFVREIVAVKFKAFCWLMLNNPSRIFMVITLICIILILPMRFACQIIAEDYLVTIAIVCLPTYILYLGRGIKRITTFAHIIHRVLKSDLISFLAIFVIFLMGFSQAFYIIYDYGRFPNTDGIFLTPLQSIFQLFSMADGDFEGNYNNLKKSTYNVLGRIYIIIFAVFCQLLLVNLFIATLSDTYGKTSDCQMEWLRQWAAQILCIEQTMSVSERKEVLEKYTNVIDGKRVMMIRWKQSEEEREDFVKEKSTFKNKMVDDCRISSVKKVQ